MSGASETPPAGGVGPMAPGAAWLWVGLVAIGVAWGATQPLSKFGMQAGHHPIGVTFWQAVIGLVVMTGVMVLRGQRLPLSPRHLVFYAVCGVLGTALPSSLSYEGIKHLPVGVQSMVLATVPMMTLLLALPLGLERVEWRRMGGLGLGLVAVLLIVGPDASLPEPGQAVWVLLPLAVSLSYAAENVVIARFLPPGIDPVQTMAGLLWGSLVLIAPVMLATDAVPDLSDPGWREFALFLSSALNVFCYMGFIWLIGHGGAVFAAQVGYVVTATGVAAGMIFLGERHSIFVWVALGLLAVGLALVTPRGRQGGSTP